MNGDKIVGFCLNYIQEVDTNHQSVDKTCKLKPDYHDEISTGPYPNLACNQLIVFIEQVEKNFVQFLPRCRKYLKIDIIFVMPEYTG